MAATLKSAGSCSIAFLAFGILFAGVPVGPAAAQFQGNPDPLAQQQEGNQNQSGFPNPPNRPGQHNGLPNESQLPASMVAAAARSQATDRQKRLIADSDKLLALATQLHADLARTDKNMLSVDVVRRAEAIERLARSVKDRERGQ
jgi:hypothetical protein